MDGILSTELLRYYEALSPWTENALKMFCISNTGTHNFGV